MKVSKVHYIAHRKIGNFQWEELMAEVEADADENIPGDQMIALAKEIVQGGKTKTPSTPEAQRKVSNRRGGPEAEEQPQQRARPQQGQRAPYQGGGSKEDISLWPYAFDVSNLEREDFDLAKTILKKARYRWNGDGDKLWYGKVMPELYGKGLFLHEKLVKSPKGASRQDDRAGGGDEDFGGYDDAPKKIDPREQVSFEDDASPF